MDFTFFFLEFMYFIGFFLFKCAFLCKKIFNLFCILVLHIYKNCCILSFVEARHSMKIQHFIKSAYESLPFIISNIHVSAKWQKIIFRRITL